MKKLFALLVLNCAVIIAVAQAPQGFNYQAVVRNASGVALTSQAVGLEISLHQSTATGTIVYTETHAVVSNNLGIVNLVVGTGTPTSGTFASINWASGPYFIEISMDATGGTTYTSMGTQQLMSVPYALYAGNGGTAGATGATGLAGTNGANGADGIDGATGSTGMAGTMGVTGATGTAGTNGSAGALGATGATGTAGTNGSAGVMGATGATGSIGLMGPTGATPTAAVTFSLVNSGFSAWAIGATTDYNSGSNLNPTLTLYRGFTYQFNVTVSGHPFRIQSVNAPGGALYGVGITPAAQNVQSGVLTFKVPMDAPAQLYYFCQFHGGMTGIINIP